MSFLCIGNRAAIGRWLQRRRRQQQQQGKPRAQINNTQTKIKFLRKRLIHFADFVNVATCSELKEQMSVNFIIKIGYVDKQQQHHFHLRNGICRWVFPCSSSLFLFAIGVKYHELFRQTTFLDYYYVDRTAQLGSARFGWLSEWLASWLVKRDAHDITINRRDTREWASENETERDK